jgi:hypothetical protein
MVVGNLIVAAASENMNEKTRYRKTLKKHAEQAEDAGEIFRDIHFGQLRVAHKIKSLLEKGKSEVVQLETLALAAKRMRMTKKAPNIQQGVKIVITCSQEEPKPIPPLINFTFAWPA